MLREGDAPAFCRVLLSGCACGYKVLQDGRRQIVAIFLPGDICDHGSMLMSRLDCSIGALCLLTCGRISWESFERFSRERPLVHRALLLDMLAMVSIQREWAVNLGQRDAYERMAHLICELFARLRAVGLTKGDWCDWPLTQADLGDALGISSVHVNRTIQELRRYKLVTVSNRTLTIPDLRALEVAALFCSGYVCFNADQEA